MQSGNTPSPPRPTYARFFLCSNLRCVMCVTGLGQDADAEPGQGGGGSAAQVFIDVADIVVRR